MIDCGKAAEFIERGDFEQISFWKKRKLKLHLKVCAMCAKYEEDNRVLSKVIKMAGVKYCDNHLSKEEKVRIKAHLESQQ